MNGNRKRTSAYNQAKRLRFPADEVAQPWLSMLLDAYCIVDRGVAEAVRAEARRGKRLACSKGCSSCCKTHSTIPIYPLELVGLSWYVIEKLNGPLRQTVRGKLEEYKENDACPFLVTGACSVHPMRPVACRQFMVFEKPCAEDEDPYYTRREDVLNPIRRFTDQAFFIMLPFYGVKDESERRNIIEKGAVHQVVKLMQTCNWKSLAEKITEFDKGAARDTL